MAEEKKRLTAVERAELALAEAKAKAEEKNKLKRKAGSKQFTYLSSSIPQLPNLNPMKRTRNIQRGQ